MWSFCTVHSSLSVMSNFTRLLGKRKLSDLYVNRWLFYRQPCKLILKQLGLQITFPEQWCVRWVANWFSACSTVYQMLHRLLNVRRSFSEIKRGVVLDHSVQVQFRFSSTPIIWAIRLIFRRNGKCPRRGADLRLRHCNFHLGHERIHCLD